ncbi:MAG: T9SS type A sorting domain-containing protein, partial [Bacteroidota bacterium]
QTNAMRNFILLLFTSFTFFSLNAQISINNNDMPVPGYAPWLSTPDTLFQIDASLTGPNFTWDFSGMTAIAQNRDSFISVNNVPLLIRVQFPFSANLVRYLPTPDSIGPVGLGEGFQIFLNNSGGFQNLGFGGEINGIPLVLENDPVEVIYDFPLQFGNEDSSSSVAELSVPGLVFYRQERTRVSEVDGWGSLTTPYGSFDVLRQKSVVTGRDSIAFDTLNVAFSLPKQAEYKWLAKEEGVPVLQVTTTISDSLNLEIPTSVAYVDSFRNLNPPTSIERPRVESLAFYPNPASDQLQIAWSDMLSADARLEVIDINGKIVLEKAIHSGFDPIPLGGLSQGVYQVRLWNHGQWFAGKLLIQR